MKKILSSIVIQIVFAIVAHAQVSISPVIGELHSKKNVARGEFTLQNNSLRPVFVTVDAKSFNLMKSAAGDAISVFRPLDAKLEFSETSFRLGPQESREVSYRLQCVSYPCAVEVWASFIVGKSDSGMQIRVAVPTAIYACSDKAKGCRARVRKSAGIEDIK